MDSVLDVLVAARGLLAKPRGWGKGSYARRLPDGRVAYCAVGALSAASSSPRARTRAEFALTEAAGCNIVAYNDRKTTRKADVLAVYDKAIATRSAA